MGVIFAILFTVLLVLAAGIAIFCFVKVSKSGRKETAAKGLGFGMTGAAVVALLLLIFIPAGYQTVNTGEIAVVKVWGEAVDTLGAGLHFRNIISTEYVVYDLKTQQMDIDNEVYTKDAQPLQIQMTIQFSIKSSKEDVLSINKTYGTLDILSTRIRNIAIEKSKVILSAKTAMELIETRDKISPDVLNEIKKLESQYFITVENVVIMDMAFSSAFESAVEQKMIAEQEQLKAKYDKEKAIIKAEEELEVAKKNAEAAVAKAKGDADAAVAIAKGEAQSLKLKSIEAARMLGFEIKDIIIDGVLVDQEIITENQTPEKVKLISEYLKYIEYLNTWDGKLPTVVGDGFDILIPINP